MVTAAHLRRQVLAAVVVACRPTAVTTLAALDSQVPYLDRLPCTAQEEAVVALTARVAAQVGLTLATAPREMLQVVALPQIVQVAVEVPQT